MMGKRTWNPLNILLISTGFICAALAVNTFTMVFLLDYLPITVITEIILVIITSLSIYGYLDLRSKTNK